MTMDPTRWAPLPVINRVISYNSYLDSRGGTPCMYREEFVTNLTASEVGDETRASEMFGVPWGVWVYIQIGPYSPFRGKCRLKKIWKFITGLEKLGESVRPSET